MRAHHKLAILALAVTCSVAFAAVRRTSTAKITAGSNEQSSFCTVDGNIFVGQNCSGQDAYSGCAGGITLLEGPSTQRLGPGNHSIPSGCYTHKIASGSVWGSAVMTSSVSYNSKD